MNSNDTENTPPLFCQKCGAQFEGAQQFCSKCGSPRTVTGDFVQNKRTGKGFAVTSFVFGIFALVYSAMVIELSFADESAVGIIPTIVTVLLLSVIFGIISFAKYKRKLALTGLILSAVSIIILIVPIILRGTNSIGQNKGSKSVSTGAFSVKDLANGEYQIISDITIYDSSLKAIEAKITYSPSETIIGKNALFLYANNEIFGFGDNTLTWKDFIEIVDKCIEWSNLAKENDVHALQREVKTRVGIVGTGAYNVTPYIVDFLFTVKEINRKEETLLLMNYRTLDQQNEYQWSGNNTGGFIAFKERDFNNLKKIFSGDLLAQVDKIANEKKEKEQLFK